MTSAAKQRVEFGPEHRPAGIVTRMAAAGIDLAVVVVLWSLIYATVAGARLIWSPTTFEWPTPPVWLTFGLGLVLAVLYLTASWAVLGDDRPQLRRFTTRLASAVVPPGASRLGAVVRPGELLCVLPGRPFLGDPQPRAPLHPGRRPAHHGRLRLARRGLAQRRVARRRPVQPGATPGRRLPHRKVLTANGFRC